MTIESKAMKSTEENISYPCLMEYKNRVVLFFKERCGVVVWVDSSVTSSGVGYHSQLWDMELFTRFSGEVSIKNKE